MPWIKPVKMSEMKSVMTDSEESPTVFHRLMGHTPELLTAFTPLQNAVKQVSLSDLMRERLITYVSNLNGCTYCTAGHTKALEALGETEKNIQALLDSRISAFDDRTQAVLTYARRLVQDRNELSRESFEEMKRAGMSEREVVEVNHVTAYTSYTNQLSIGLGL
ncbi:carboxymuconolactone decarboxylase family protein [Alteribacter natronophilus]|uniref:carboxymuconolactone decarboxylase family protein n=1 Tax=Alteribacter natronophilus TaxID=2583810 RepID=UPI00110EB0DC|nr:carboxymuconolactone decarboxylase family protein [Alteribacter natronophilus]TMW70276.1 hypothetical protein FGB90_16495 [Alteribacter natronophilus]